MSRFANISGEKAIKIFEKFGYKLGLQSGSHIILYHNSRPTISVPNLKEIAPYLLWGLIKISGISEDDFLKHK